MQKTATLKELPKLFISSGMTQTELCEYLGVSEELIQEWERFFNIFPEKASNEEKIYSEKRIRDFIKIKDSLDRGTPLHEVRRRLFKIKTEPATNNMTTSPATATNPFENKQDFVQIKPEELQAERPLNKEEIIRPFLTQINKANERIGELLLEKARIVEEAAIEKANLMSDIRILHIKNTELQTERERLFDVIKEKEDQLKTAAIQEETIAEALKRSHEMLKQKEDEIFHIQNRVELYEQEVKEKDSIIYNQSQEIDRLLEKQNRKWWHVIRDWFF